MRKEIKIEATLKKTQTKENIFVKISYEGQMHGHL